MKKRILCFGDSLTWGWNPTERGVPVERYGPDERWTGVLAGELGPDHEIIEEGLSGRTTDLDDPTDSRLNGSTYLPPCLATHLPLDLVVLMLGTNDTKTYFHRDPFTTAAAMGRLVADVAHSFEGVGTAYPAPGVVLVAPPPLAEMPAPWFRELFAGAREKTLRFAELYRDLAVFLDIPFLDAGSVIATEGVDGIHFSRQNNLDLGKSMAEFLRREGLV